jgi:hypothetical protein
VVSVLVKVLFSPGWLMMLVMTEPGSVAYSVSVCLPPGAVKVEPGRVVVRYSVNVVRSPGAVCKTVGPGTVRVMTEVRTTEWLYPGAVWKLVKVAPGKLCVNVIVAGCLDGPCGVQDGETKLVYVSPGRVRVSVSTEGAETGPIGTEHVAVVRV